MFKHKQVKHAYPTYLQSRPKQQTNKTNGTTIKDPPTPQTKNFGKPVKATAKLLPPHPPEGLRKGFEEPSPLHPVPVPDLLGEAVAEVQIRGLVVAAVQHHLEPGLWPCFGFCNFFARAGFALNGDAEERLRTVVHRVSPMILPSRIIK